MNAANNADLPVHAGARHHRYTPSSPRQNSASAESSAPRPSNAELPDNATAAAACLAAAASGAVGTQTVVLLTPDEIDQAARQKVSYRPPGAQ
ncbi:GYD domain-containing protein [Dactylosporangium sp. NPDC005555]|uniref:GYD domain-containing protein n=1 Tax=Dactylosporangium sp. NPDC005555 TaxID=3154889 RepID=UPI0033ABA233